MIRIMDWVAVIPEEDKRIGYVGEHETVLRQFLLTGEEADTYRGWTFHLDMRFDVSTVTKSSTRQTERVEEEQNETMTETSATLSATTQRESATVTDVQIDCTNQTDVAYLSQAMCEEGLLLTWTVLSQQTQMPGNLWATLRAVNADGRVKKSAVMVFTVGPAMLAVPAAVPEKSEFEQMELRMDQRLTAIEEVSSAAVASADVAKEYADLAMTAMSEVEDLADTAIYEATEAARSATSAATSKVAAAASEEAAKQSAEAAAASAADAKMYSGMANSSVSEAFDYALDAHTFAQQAATSAQQATDVASDVGDVAAALDAILAMQQALIGGGTE